MINKRTEKEIQMMRNAAKVLIETFNHIEKFIKPGIKTRTIDKEIDKVITKAGAYPAFKGYRGFPASACISIDEVVVHGIPGDRILEEGQIVGIDIGVKLEGYYSDAARTFPVGKVSDEKQKLLKITEDSLQKAIDNTLAGNKISDISIAVQKYAEENGFSVVRELVGHGIGNNLHEEPEIPNFVDEFNRSRPSIQEGMVFAIEPMINTGVKEVEFLSDGWTVVTADRQPSAHFEHTVAVTGNGPEILTLGR